MTLSIRFVDDCITTVPDVGLLAIYESQKKYMDSSLLNVSCQKKDSGTFHYEDVVDLEVF